MGDARGSTRLLGECLGRPAPGFPFAGKTALGSPMPPPTAASLAFDDVLIDFAGRRLLRDGSEQPLEPKAFGVLALLAGVPGRAFARDEILDAVWGHRHVTPGVLNRVMTLLRHALGEDAHTPRYLHTVHGVGYRFDLPAPTAAAEAPLAPGMPTDPVAHAPVPKRRAGDVARSARRRPRAAMIGGALLLVLAAAAVLWRPEAAMPAPAATAPTRPPSPTLVVMPLRPIGDGSGVRTIADGLSEELICSLARINGLRVIARESTQLLGQGNATGAQPQRLGITHALEGNLQQSGQRLRVRMRMIETDSGSLLWTREFDRDATEALSLQRDIAEAVAASLTLKLGLSVPTARGGDADFQRRFLGARLLTMRFDLPPDASIDKAEAELRALVRERPDDARTHAWLAVALRLRSYRRPGLAPALAAEAVREARLASRLDPSRYEPYLVLAADDCRHQRWEPCMARLARAQAMAPGLVYVHADQATALGQLGYLDRAEAHAREGLARDPLNPGTHQQLARLLDTRGKHDEALRHFQRAGPRMRHGRWFNALWRGDAAGALGLAEDFDAADAFDPGAARLKPSSVAVARAFATPALWPQALDELDRYERENPGRMQFARLLAPDAATHADALATQLIAARAGEYSSFGLLLWTKDLAYLRRTPAFQQHLRDSGILAYWREHGFPEQCRPQGNGAACG